MNDTKGEAVSEQIRAAIEFCHGFDEAPDGDVASAELAALEARVEAAEKLNSGLTNDFNAMLVEASKQESRAVAAEGRLQAATDALRTIGHDPSPTSCSHCIETRAAARAVLVGGTPHE